MKNVESQGHQEEQHLKATWSIRLTSQSGTDFMRGFLLLRTCCSTWVGGGGASLVFLCSLPCASQSLHVGELLATRFGGSLWPRTPALSTRGLHCTMEGGSGSPLVAIAAMPDPSCSAAANCGNVKGAAEKRPLQFFKQLLQKKLRAKQNA